MAVIGHEYGDEKRKQVVDMKGKNMLPKPIAGRRRERMVYEGVEALLKDAGANPAEGIAILLHTSVALAEHCADTPVQMRLVQTAMIEELNRSFNRAIGTADAATVAARPRWAWIERIKIAVRLRYGLFWRT